jgi:hypothetical protein
VTVKAEVGSLTRTARVKVTVTEWGSRPTSRSRPRVRPSRSPAAAPSTPRWAGMARPTSGSGSPSPDPGRWPPQWRRCPARCCRASARCSLRSAPRRRGGGPARRGGSRDRREAGRGAGRAAVRRAREPRCAGARTLLGPADTLGRGPAVGGGGTGGPGGARRECPRSGAAVPGHRRRSDRPGLAPTWILLVILGSPTSGGAVAWPQYVFPFLVLLAWAVVSCTVVALRRRAAPAPASA